MSLPRIVRLVSRPGLLGAVLFVATMGLAAALGYQAVAAARSSRATAEATLSRYAAIAAWQYGRQARLWVGFGMNQASAQLAREVSMAPAGSLPGPEVVRRALAEKECDCMSAGFSRTVFRVMLGPRPELIAEGAPLSDATRREIEGIAATDTATREGPRQWRIVAPGTPALERDDDVVFLWQLRQRVAGVETLRAVYGMIVEVAQLTRPLKGALADSEFFPPSLVGGLPTDSLIRITVAAPNGRPMLDGGPARTAFVGSDTLGVLFGGMTVTASVEPAAADRLVAGGLPAARTSQITMLLGLALLLGGAALLLLRRETRLARLREDFVSGVSHELRTPLTQIRMLSELLDDDGIHGDAERARAVGVIRRETVRLTNLVDNVLQFGRLRRNQPPVATEAVLLVRLIRDVVESIQPLLAARENAVAVEVIEDLAVHADPIAIGQILRNLLENAIKYGAVGQTIRVTLLRGEPADRARIVVDDEGPGIPVVERARIWEPYRRLERDVGAPVAGSGIGLSVVAQLVSMIGGRAWVTNAPNQGARFVIELPGAFPAEEPS